MNTIQVRVSDDLKKQATYVYDELGLDLSTAVRMFLKKSVAVNGIPFSTKLDNKSLAKKAIENMNNKSVEKGNSSMSLNEINKIIDKTRQQRKQ